MFVSFWNYFRCKLKIYFRNSLNNFREKEYILDFNGFSFIGFFFGGEIILYMFLFESIILFICLFYGYVCVLIFFSFCVIFVYVFCRKCKILIVNFIIGYMKICWVDWVFF